MKARPQAAAYKAVLSAGSYMARALWLVLRQPGSPSSQDLARTASPAQAASQVCLIVEDQVAQDEWAEAEGGVEEARARRLDIARQARTLLHMARATVVVLRQPTSLEDARRLEDQLRKKARWAELEPLSPEWWYAACGGGGRVEVDRWCVAEDSESKATPRPPHTP